MPTSSFSACTNDPHSLSNRYFYRPVGTVTHTAPPPLDAFLYDLTHLLCSDQQPNRANTAHTAGFFGYIARLFQDAIPTTQQVAHTPQLLADIALCLHALMVQDIQDSSAAPTVHSALQRTLQCCFTHLAPPHQDQLIELTLQALFMSHASAQSMWALDALGSYVDGTRMYHLVSQAMVQYTQKKEALFIPNPTADATNSLFHHLLKVCLPQWSAQHQATQLERQLSSTATTTDPNTPTRQPAPRSMRL